jgi:hypothetical protein
MRSVSELHGQCTHVDVALHAGRSLTTHAGSTSSWPTRTRHTASSLPHTHALRGQLCACDQQCCHLTPSCDCTCVCCVLCVLCTVCAVCCVCVCVCVLCAVCVCVCVCACCVCCVLCVYAPLCAVCVCVCASAAELFAGTGVDEFVLTRRGDPPPAATAAASAAISLKAHTFRFEL